jgi:hypothetical protein
MYQITKGANKIEKDLEIVTSGGEEIAVLHVSISMREMETRVAKAYEAMSIARAELQKKPDAVEAYGKAVIAFMETIFGDDQTAQLLEIYESDYTQMLLDVVPFIQDEIMPALKAVSTQTKERMLQAANQYKRPIFGGVFRK